MQLWFRGAPLGGQRLTVASRADDVSTMTVVTASDGQASFPVDRGGLWLVATVAMARGPAGGETDWASTWASLAFEVPHGVAPPNP